MDVKRISSRCADTPGNFRFLVYEGKLFLPQDLYDLMGDHARTAITVVSCLGSFPSHICKGLCWEMEDLQKAQETLLRALEGHVPHEVLHPGEPQKRAYGALPPGNRKNL